jgi:predicted ArsR family transcriptional regulator
MDALAEADALRSAEIAVAVGADRNTISSTLSRLLQMGVVVALPPPDDRRYGRGRPARLYRLAS